MKSCRAVQFISLILIGEQGPAIRRLSIQALDGQAPDCSSPASGEIPSSRSAPAAAFLPALPHPLDEFAQLPSHGVPRQANPLTVAGQDPLEVVCEQLFDALDLPRP